MHQQIEQVEEVPVPITQGEVTHVPEIMTQTHTKQELMVEMTEVPIPMQQMEVTHVPDVVKQTRIVH